jgi:hypothetical protein
MCKHFVVSTCIMLSFVPLANRSYMTKPRVFVGGSYLSSRGSETVSGGEMLGGSGNCGHY